MTSIQTSVDIKLALNDITFKPLEVKIEEKLSNEYSYIAMLQIDKSELNALNHQFKQLINTSISITLNQSEDQLYYHGIIEKVELQANKNKLIIYAKTPLSELHYNNRFKVYSKKSHIDVIHAIIESSNAYNSKQLVINCDHLTQQYPSINTITQYNESDYHFLHRIIRKLGINYFFTFDEQTTTINFYDNQNILPDNDIPTLIDKNHTEHDKNAIHQSTGTSQAYFEQITVNDYNFRTPNELLNVHKSSDSIGQIMNKIYPGQYNNKQIAEYVATALMNKQLSKNTEQQIQIDNLSLSTAHAINIFDGSTDMKYFIHQTHKHIKLENHFANQSSSNHYQNNIIHISYADINYQPNDIFVTPTMYGICNAIVVGNDNKVVDIDNLGCIKIQFQWESISKNQPIIDNIAYVRLLQNQASNTSGTLWIPRSGEEVLVSFQNGDIDKPIVIGSAYNDNNRPPFTLPQERYTTGMKLCSHTDTEVNTSRSNEVKFVNESQQEQIHIKAQRDYHELVENNAYTFVKGDMKTTIDHGNNTISATNGSINLQAHKRIDLKVGASVVSLKSSCITFEAPLILLNPFSIGTANQASTDNMLAKQQNKSYSMTIQDAFMADLV